MYMLYVTVVTLLGGMIQVFCSLHPVLPFPQSGARGVRDFIP